MTYSRVKVQGHWSVGSEDRVETNGRTDGWTEAIALSPVVMRSVMIPRYFIVSDIPRMSVLAIIVSALLLQTFEVRPPPPPRCATAELFVLPAGYYHLATI